MNHALSLTLTLSRKEREQRSPRAEAPHAPPFARCGLRLSLPQRGRAGVRENGNELSRRVQTTELPHSFSRPEKALA